MHKTWTTCTCGRPQIASNSCITSSKITPLENLRTLLCLLPSLGWCLGEDMAAYPNTKFRTRSAPKDAVILAVERLLLAGSIQRLSSAWNILLFPFMLSFRQVFGTGKPVLKGLLKGVVRVQDKRNCFSTEATRVFLRLQCFQDNSRKR